MAEEEYVERYQTVPLFEGLEHSEIADLLRNAEDITASEGDEIFRQGDPADGFFVIGAGEFEILKTGRESKVLAKLSEFSYFGEMTLFLDSPRTATAICVESGRLKKFSKTKFNTLLDDGHPTAMRVVRNMARILAERLHRLDEKFVR